ncbi:hypothetical protein G6F59_014344 [Rhizopus arrhizus]|nr:hypothetical protein G6F59_014344 [Rhizopus arrhizus]
MPGSSERTGAPVPLALASRRPALSMAAQLGHHVGVGLQVGQGDHLADFGVGIATHAHRADAAAAEQAATGAPAQGGRRGVALADGHLRGGAHGGEGEGHVRGLAAEVQAADHRTSLAADQPAQQATDGVAADVQAHRQAQRAAVHFLHQVGHRHRRYAAQRQAKQGAQHQQRGPVVHQCGAQRQGGRREQRGDHQRAAADRIGQQPGQQHARQQPHRGACRRQPRQRHHQCHQL